jgi:hypothetical protein
MDNVSVMKDVYSELTNILVTKGRLDHDMTFNAIKEYLAYNLNDFTRFAFGNKQDERENICYFTFDSKVDHPYVLCLDLKKGEINYLIQKPINILEAINNKERVIAFTFNFETGCFTKEVIDGMYSYIEKYYLGRKVENKVYLTHDLEEAIRKIKFEGLMSNRTDFISYPIYLTRSNPIISYEVEVLNPIKEQKDYLLSVIKPNRIDREPILSSDSSLYAAYYDEMIDKGCFTSEQSKKSK